MFEKSKVEKYVVQCARKFLKIRFRSWRRKFSALKVCWPPQVASERCVKMDKFHLDPLPFWLWHFCFFVPKKIEKWEDWKKAQKLSIPPHFFSISRWGKVEEKRICSQWKVVNLTPIGGSRLYSRSISMIYQFLCLRTSPISSLRKVFKVSKYHSNIPWTAKCGKKLHEKWCHSVSCSQYILRRREGKKLSVT